MRDDLMDRIIDAKSNEELLHIVLTDGVEGDEDGSPLADVTASISDEIGHIAEEISSAVPVTTDRILHSRLIHWRDALRRLELHAKVAIEVAWKRGEKATAKKRSTPKRAKARRKGE